MTYVDAAVAPLRKTGQIKIHGPAAFEAMRKAGQLVARCLDMLTEHVTPGVPTEKIVLAAEEVEALKDSDLSIMPEGQLDALTREQVRDLIAYLASKTQVPLPPPAKEKK